MLRPSTVVTTQPMHPVAGPVGSRPVSHTFTFSGAAALVSSATVFPADPLPALPLDEDVVHGETLHEHREELQL